MKWSLSRDVRIFIGRSEYYKVRRKHTYFVDSIEINILNIMVNNLTIFIVKLWINNFFTILYIIINIYFHKLKLDLFIILIILIFNLQLS